MPNTPPASLASTLVTRMKPKAKREYLAELSEDDFRDRVIRRLFERKGMRFLRDTCGPDEEGKDSVFQSVGPFGDLQIHVVQTKRGKLTMGSSPSDNVTRALTQLMTALDTDVFHTPPEGKSKPDKVYLCVSGTISNNVRRHLESKLDDTRVVIWSADEIIRFLDEIYPEFWIGVSTDRFPYLRSLQKYLLESSDALALSELGLTNRASPIEDEAFVQVYLTRIEKLPPTRRRGQVFSENRVVEITFDKIPTEKSRLVLVTGDGGSGKSTGLRRLAFTLCDQALTNNVQGLVPILLTASTLAHSTGSVIDACVESAQSLPGVATDCFSPDDLEAGQVAILIDALDELKPEERNVALSKVLDFHRRYPRCLLVLTSRDYSSVLNLPSMRRFTRYRLVPMTASQAKKIVNRLTRDGSLPPEHCQEMLRRLQDVHGVSLSPLIVTIFAATSDFTKQDIPPNITEIFKKYTELMLGRWDEKKGLKQQFHAPLKDFLLRRLALHMHARRERAVSLEACRSIFDAELKKRDLSANLDLVFDEIVHRSSLFRLEDGQIGFRHHLFQEYFAGRGLQGAAQIADVMGDDWWRAPIVFYYGDRADGTIELKDILSKIPADSATLFQAAITLGLAVQACYLAELTDKVAAMRWVVTSLAESLPDYMKTVAPRGSSAFPVSVLLGAYLQARDAVGCKVIQHLGDDLYDTASNLLPPEVIERRCFWRIAGMIEANLLEEAQVLLKNFKPSNRHLFVPLHLGLFTIANLRITNAGDKSLAAKMAESLAKAVPDLLMEVQKEFQGLLIEIREGKIFTADNSDGLLEELGDEAGSPEAR